MEEPLRYGKIAGSIPAFSDHFILNSHLVYYVISIYISFIVLLFSLLFCIVLVR
jgi:hypothetical protein